MANPIDKLAQGPLSSMYDPFQSYGSSSARQTESLLENNVRRISALEGMLAQKEAPKYNSETYGINLGRPHQVIHHLQNGIMVTNVGMHDGARLEQWFFADYLDYANYLIAEAAKKELEK